MSPALAGRFFTTEPPGKPHPLLFGVANASISSNISDVYALCHQMVQTGLASFALVVVIHSLDSQWFPSTCQRWKSQVGRHHELRDKDSISQSSTSGWGAQDGGGLLARWTCATEKVSILTVPQVLLLLPSGFCHRRHFRLHPPPGVSVLL